jgi:uncharacterized protein (UPF0335 family)
MTDLLDTDFVPSDPAIRKQVRDAIFEAAGLKQIQKDKGDQIKDIVDMLYDDHGIPKKTSRKAIMIAFKDNYQETTVENSMLEVFVENVGIVNN